MPEPWRVKLFGWLRATLGEQSVSRFPTKTASLLAVLAFQPGRPHSRDELAEMLWPDADPDAARNRFRVALSALRAMLEPPGVEDGSVLAANRTAIHLNPGAIETDVAEFETALEQAKTAPPQERVSLLSRAVYLSRGGLLPGLDESWIVPERERLGMAEVDALCALAAAQAECGDVPAAIESARRAVNADPLCEPAHQHLMAFYLRTDEPAAALRQYRDLRRLLRREIGQPPSPEIRSLAEQIRTRLREKAAATPRASQDAEAPATEVFSPLLPPRYTPAAQPSTLPEAPRLPRPLTRFFGREAEMERVCAALERGSDRLITLTGPGGSGKTRLALEAARRLEETFCGAIWFVPLAEQNDACFLPDAILDALHLRQVATVEPLEQIIAALNPAPSLLVLDSFERLAGDGASVVRELLERLPRLRCLVTSQILLHISGERETPIAPLDIPNGTRVPEHLQAYPSVQLFVDRAQAVRPDFQVNERNVEAVATLCRRLEGIPLAIELAAAWTNTLTPSQMLDRLSRRFDLLVARRQDVLDRHRALRTALDWSYQLLPPDLQRAFARLSVFRNGWTLEAAQEVCDDPNALEHVAALRERSLLVAEDDGAEMHFSMLNSLHDYAEEHLSQEEAETLARRHAEWYLGLVQTAEPALYGPALDEWLERLERQHENIRAAIDFGLGPGGDPCLAGRLAGKLIMFWEHHGHFQEGRRYLARVLAAGAACVNATDEEARLCVLNGAARLAVCQGDAREGDAFAREALPLARTLGNRRQEAIACRNLAYGAYIHADFETAKEHARQAIAISRELEDTWALAAALDDLGTNLTRTGENDDARTSLTEALRLNRQIGNREGIASALFGLGILARETGDLATARGYLEQSLAACRELKDLLLIALSCYALGTVVALDGQTDDGRARLEESLDIFRDLKDSRGLLFNLFHLAMYVERRTDPDRASAYLREGLRTAHELGDPRYALYNMYGLAALAADSGDGERAARLLGKAEFMREEIHHPWPTYIRSGCESLIQAVRLMMPEMHFDALFAEGSAMPLDDAVRYALDEIPMPTSSPAGH